MKSKLTWGMAAAALLLGAYSIMASHLLRGAGAYRLGTRLGSVLAAGRPFCTPASVVLLVIVIIRLAVAHKRKKASESEKEQMTGKIQPAGPVTEEGKILPYRGISETAAALEEQETVIVEETAPMEQETILVNEDTVSEERESVSAEAADRKAQEFPPVPQETLLVDGAETVFQQEDQSGPEFTGLENAEPVKPMLLKPQKSTKRGLPFKKHILRDAEEPPVCAKCGAVGKPGQSFCTKCGSPMKGENQ